jgi:hypothetical protein
MAPLIAGIVSSLISNNLPKMAQAVVDKGLEYVEEKTGIKLEPNMSQEKIVELKLAAQKHEEFKIDALTSTIKIEEQELSKRHNADMLSDSYLSKNIRPMTLIALLFGYFLFALMSAFGYNANESYVNLLGEWGILIMSFYFGGRTVEKVMQMIQQKGK